MVAEAERSLNDGLKVVAAVLEDGYAVPGGGATEIELSLRLREFAQTVGGREQLAVESFASALEIIPWTLAENGGLDAISILLNLKSAHEGKKAKNQGLALPKGEIADMYKECIVEPKRVKVQALNSATEAAVMIIRIDDVIASKKSEPPAPPAGPPGGGGYGGMGGMGGMPPMEY